MKGPTPIVFQDRRFSNGCEHRKRQEMGPTFELETQSFVRKDSPSPPSGVMPLAPLLNSVFSQLETLPK